MLKYAIRLARLLPREARMVYAILGCRPGKVEKRVLLTATKIATQRAVQMLERVEERAAFIALAYSYRMVGETLKILFGLSDEELKGRWVDFKASIGEVIYNSIVEATTTIREIAAKGVDEGNVRRLASALDTLLRTLRGMFMLLAELTPAPKRHIIEYLASIFEAQEKMVERMLAIKG